MLPGKAEPLAAESIERRGRNSAKVVEEEIRGRIAAERMRAHARKGLLFFSAGGSRVARAESRAGTDSARPTRRAGAPRRADAKSGISGRTIPSAASERKRSMPRVFARRLSRRLSFPIIRSPF